jgi:hypothetical protein
MTWLRLSAWACIVCGLLLLGFILAVELWKTSPLPVPQGTSDGSKKVWTLPDLSGIYYGSKIPLRPGDCVRVTATRTLEKMDVCHGEVVP